MTPDERPTVYRLRVKGPVDAARAERLGGLSVVHEREGVTTLSGPVADQAALYGIIVGLRDMGLELLDVRRVRSDTPSGAADSKED